MTTRTWSGTTGSFSNAAGWSGGIVPVAGDTAVINSGTVSATGALPTPLTLVMDGTSGSTLVLADASLGAGTSLTANDQTGFVGLKAGGNAVNAGVITFSGKAGGEADILLLDGAGGTATSFINSGGISIVGQQAVVANQGQNLANRIVNNGVISFRSGGTTGNTELVSTPIDGTGTIRLQPNTNLQLGNKVGSGQHVLFEAGSGASTLFLGSGSQFNGVIDGFGASDQVRISTTPYDNFTYALSNGVGTFTFTQSSTVVGQVSFAGNTPQSAFTVTKQPNSLATTITTSVANQPARVSFTDTVNGVQGDEAATPYTGPVAGLQYQYIWSSPDSVAMSSSVPNVFLKGGAAGDALQVSSGDNVLDGGGGSNFLVGGIGTGHDTFFVDGRGGVVTWSTIVNFHLGDQATIFGFQAGTSTRPLTASDGAQGYTGVTIHSELQGSGTGVNESITLTGLTVADFNNHMTVTTGTLSPGTSSALPYLLIQYDH